MAVLSPYRLREGLGVGLSASARSVFLRQTHPRPLPQAVGGDFPQ